MQNLLHNTLIRLIAMSVVIALLISLGGCTALTPDSGGSSGTSNTGQISGLAK